MSLLEDAAKILQGHDDEVLGMCYEDAARDVLKAVLDALAEPSEVVVEHGGHARVYPSTYMGGAPEQAKRDADRIWQAMLAKFREEHGIGQTGDGNIVVSDEPDDALESKAAEK